MTAGNNPIDDPRAWLERHQQGVKCAECGSSMKLRTSRYGLFYGCSEYPDCSGTHGAHPDGAPLGTPATKETKRARIAAHASFDQLWKSGAMSRSAAYRWMQRAMKMTKGQAHIGKMDFDQCIKLMMLVDGRLGTPQHKWLEIQAKERHAEAAKEEEGDD